jgi:murein DD-endopeptidase MepM/ murein hydrolase activator NlpD
MHKGIDLICVKGRHVYAAHAGFVTKAGWENEDDPKQGYGLRIAIAALDGSIVTVYAHLERITCGVGQPVGAGEVIGHAGRTGNVGRGTPTHLHFEVRAPGPVDPRAHLEQRAVDPDTGIA